MGVGALAVDAESVKRASVRGRAVAVRAVAGARAGMRRHALDENFEAADALAPCDDLATVARRLRHQHVFGLAAFLLDQGPRGGLPISSSDVNMWVMPSGGRSAVAQSSR